MFIHIKIAVVHVTIKATSLSFHKVAAKTVAVPQTMRSRWPIPGKLSSAANVLVDKTFIAI